MNQLLVLILVPLVAAMLVAMAPAKHARNIAIAGTLIAAIVAAYIAGIFDYQMTSRIQLKGDVEWVKELGLRFSLGIDSVSLVLILLTALLGPICVFASTTAVTERLKLYYGWLLVLQAAMTGVFASRDIILFYVCFEFTLVPMFILIRQYGSTNRVKASTKFFLYTFTGSVITLAGLVYIAWYAAQRTGVWSFDIDTLQEVARVLPPSTQAWLLLAMMAGFAVKVPLFPVHTWLPLAHTEAPTAGSVILAGVLLKLGTYGLFRFVLPFLPHAVLTYAPVIGVLCVIGIIYGGLICWVQTDVKKLVAYSSVAHLGFCVLGLFALNGIGITGSVTYMINHGLSTGALFLLIGMIYERYHTRNMKELGGLATKMPVWSTFMVFFAMASVGLPGLNGFVSEFMCLLGTFQASSGWGRSELWGTLNSAVPGATNGNLGPWYAAVAGIGMIIAAMYLLYMVGKVVWGPLVEPAGHGGHGHGHGHGHDAHKDHAHSVLPTDLNAREIATLVPLAALCLILGVYPKPLLKVLEEPIVRVAMVLDEARKPTLPPGLKPGMPTKVLETVAPNSNTTARSADAATSEAQKVVPQ